MPQAVYILFGAAFTVIVSIALGRVLLRSLALRLYREEENPLAFVTGAALLSGITFLICAAGLARKGVFLAVGLAVIAIAVRRGAHKTIGDPLPALPRLWAWVLGLLFTVYAVLYFFNAMAPEASPDGSSYHLGLVGRYLRARGFERITTHMYANLSQGVEMLFLFAFSFGRHSAAALVHFAFLVTLPLAMVSCGRRFGYPGAGAFGALLVFLSPVIGMDGTTAYIDVAVACVVFALFYLIEIWAEDPAGRRGALVAIGLLAGFGYAAKYTAVVALPYALGRIVWTLWRRGRPIMRPSLIVAGCALAMMLPWMLKNWIWLQNPFSPFLNAVFPNPYVHVSFERDYAWYMRNYDELKSHWAIPLEVTVRGAALGGLLGPVFLLAPFALLSLRIPAGRQALLAALVFGMPYAANIGTRFLIPAAPFLALSLGLALARWQSALAVLAVAHAIASWPDVMKRYCDRNNWRLTGVPLKAALRIEPEERYIARKMPQYEIARLVERTVPRGERVLMFTAVPEAYTTRETIVAYESAFGNLANDVLQAAWIRQSAPAWRQRFRFPEQRLRGVRVVQTASHISDLWSVTELRVLHGEREIPRAPDWRLRAHPKPWDVQLAFDNSPVTRWRSWQPLFPGMFIEADFATAEMADTVLLECANDYTHFLKLRLEGRDEHGEWKTLSETPEGYDVPAPLGLRRAATEELKSRGIGYLLFYPSDFGAADFREKSVVWGVTPVGEYGGTKLYRID